MKNLVPVFITSALTFSIFLPSSASALVNTGKSTYVSIDGQLRLFQFNSISSASENKFLGVFSDGEKSFDYLFKGRKNEKFRGDFVETQIPFGYECHGTWAMTALGPQVMKLTRTYSNFSKRSPLLKPEHCPSDGKTIEVDVFIPGFWERLGP